MTDGHLSIKRRQRRAQNRCRVPLHQNQIWPFGCEVPIDCFQRPGGQRRQRLARPHQVQVRVGPDTKHLQYLIEHLPVLRGDANATLKARVVSQRQDDRSQFDGFGPGAEDDADFHEWSALNIISNGVELRLPFAGLSHPRSSFSAVTTCPWVHLTLWQAERGLSQAAAVRRAKARWDGLGYSW